MPKSFIISHWMDSHPTSLEAPEFKWQVMDSYGDALRRQLSEGLHIMEAGALNKRLEFHNNIICRLRPSTSQDMSENELQKALEKKRVYHSKINKFIDVMSNMNSVIVNRKKKNETYCV